ncbi:general secretion pathway protein GspB [Sedimenticola hydrogenitrophicus]|uniref:general secretion pathway protein GspB n=1 Tax=Sedimenticola hydrogenitrophicus TaxID=2967975 RepID=UPI0021A64A67|nr:general secretion pathway protein GspB [Sedimenticola hydrogenitrophicus]
MSKRLRYAIAGVLLLALMPAAAGELRDPLEPYGFRPVSPGVSAETRGAMFDANSLRLSGIFVGPDGASAVINGRRLRVGDEVTGAQLVRIESHAVELDLDGDRFKIELLPITVKTPARRLSGGGE